MQELKSLPAHLTGGNFLLGETDPDLVFTPEDLSSEQRLMAQTAEKFMEKEVLPNVDALEHARWANSSPYEILCNISKRVPRRYVS